MNNQIIDLSNSIYMIKNFYQDPDSLVDYINASQDVYQYHSGDNSYNFCTSKNDSFYEKGIILSRSIKNAIESIFKTKLKYRDYLSIVIYLKGGGKGLHSDEYHNAGDPINRQLIHIYSSVYYPNDQYSGGDLFFPELNINISPEKNSLVIFPSLYPHLVTDIIDGQRIAITDFWEIDHGI